MLDPCGTPFFKSLRLAVHQDRDFGTRSTQNNDITSDCDAEGGHSVLYNMFIKFSKAPWTIIDQRQGPYEHELFNLILLVSVFELGAFR